MAEKVFGNTNPADTNLNSSIMSDHIQDSTVESPLSLNNILEKNNNRLNDKTDITEIVDDMTKKGKDNNEHVNVMQDNQLNQIHQTTDIISQNTIGDSLKIKKSDITPTTLKSENKVSKMDNMFIENEERKGKDKIIMSRSNGKDSDKVKKEKIRVRTENDDDESSDNIEESPDSRNGSNQSRNVSRNNNEDPTKGRKQTFRSELLRDKENEK